MKIIISPAKKMKVDTDSLLWKDLPAFLPKTEELAAILQNMGYEELKKLWKCNDSIVKTNMERLANLDLHKGLTPALLAYEGIQYRYMAPGVFSHWEFDYVQEHLRILSGFYGILKPFDGVAPYRLEMQAKLKAGQGRDLYDFWGSALAEQLCSETDCILNLASKEYSLCISRHLPNHVRFITCVFGEEKDGEVIEKGTMCKMARGEMVRFLAENQMTNPAEIPAFHRLGYRFDEERSSLNKFIYIKDATIG